MDDFSARAACRSSRALVGVLSLAAALAGLLGGAGPAAALSFERGDSPLANQSLVSALAVGDFNADGDPDLVAANPHGDEVWVLPGAAGASFGAPSRFPVGDYPESVAVADFNADGDPDLAVANTALPSGINALSDTVSVLLGGEGEGFGAAANLAVGDVPRSIAVGDFNTDGDPDLAVANAASDTVSVLLGGPDGSFGAAANLAVGDGPVSVAVGDFNADGDHDLAVANVGQSREPSDTVSVLLGGPDGSFGAPLNLAAGEGPQSVAVGDFNADGDPDLAVANVYSDDLSVLLGGPGGSFGAPMNFAAGDGPISIAVADFHADGDPDLAVANYYSDDVSFLPGGAGGSFGAAIEFPAVAFPESVAVADFNADGRPDLAVGNAGLGGGRLAGVSLLLNTTAPAVGGSPTPAAPPASRLQRPAGPTRPPDSEGRPPRAARVTCRAHRGRRPRLRCVVRLNRATQGRRTKALLTRRGALYASGHTRRKSKRISLRARRRLRPGRYTLTLLSTSWSGKTTAVRQRVRIR